MANKTLFSTDMATKTMTIVRSFDAPLKQVWNAWTTSEGLDQWWAPKPYRAVTKSMNFKVGGFWLYAMTAPNGHIDWCRVDYKEIDPFKHILSADGFCDENGVVNKEFAPMTWKKTFTESAGITTVKNEVSFPEKKDLEKILEMGFEQGFKMGLENLDEYLHAKA